MRPLSSLVTVVVHVVIGMLTMLLRGKPRILSILDMMFAIGVLAEFFHMGKFWKDLIPMILIL